MELFLTFTQDRINQNKKKTGSETHTPMIPYFQEEQKNCQPISLNEAKTSRMPGAYTQVILIGWKKWIMYDCQGVN